MSKRFLIIMAVLVLGFVGFVAFSRSSDEPADVDLSSGSNHTKGEGQANVTLLEYGDFQCPSCASYYPILQQLARKYSNEITVQFKHYPLVQIHQNAMIAHRSAEAAANQGKFWQMHDLLYERQQTWSTSNNATRIMEDYATELALNIDEFKADFASSETNDIISADIKLGQDQGVTGTPSFFLNGERIQDPPRDAEGFEQLIEEAIQNNK